MNATTLARIGPTVQCMAIPGSPRAALIVGAGPRLGGALARRFARDGHPIGLISRSAGGVAALARSLKDGGAVVESATADVSDAAGLTAAIATLEERLGAFDVAIHNVSTGSETAAIDLPAEQLLAEFAAGAASLLTLSQAVAGPMAAAGGGTIIATGSGMADFASTVAPSLSMQKVGLRLLVKALAPGLAKTGVHCATLTIKGTLAEGTAFDPERIAEVYAGLVAQTGGPPESWETVTVYDGKS